MSDPFGRAIRDHFLNEQEEPLIDRDGEDRREYSIEEYYFGSHEEDAWRDAWMDGPLIDLGADAGRDTLYYQNHFETVDALKVTVSGNDCSVRFANSPSD